MKYINFKMSFEIEVVNILFTKFSLYPFTNNILYRLKLFDIKSELVALTSIS